MSFSLGTRKAIGEVGIDKRTENTAEPLDYPVLERGHDGAARAQTWPLLNALGWLEVALVTDGLNEENHQPVSFFFFRALEGNFYVQREGSADGSICERLGSEKHKLKHVLVIGNNDNSKQPRGIAAFHFVLQLLSCCSAII